MSIYDYRDREPNGGSHRRSPSPIWPLLVLLLLLVPAGLLVWHFWPMAHNGLDPNAKPREVTPRTTLFKDEADLVTLYEKALPSVVHINNQAVQPGPLSVNVQKVTRGSGSGFVWDKEGHIVTNYHVVKDANAVQVIFPDRSTYQATQVWVYPDKDLAVVTIDAPASKLTPIPLGTSHDLKVGQRAVVIGNPFGLDGTLTTGVISALNREIESATDEPIQGVIQTSAPINPGNSGGPLLDSEGRLVGVTTAILSPSGAFAGIGFAIPADEVNQVVPQLIAHGEVVRPGLGVELASDQQAHSQGVEEGALIWNVRPNSAAAKAGLKGTRVRNGRVVERGDVIVAINDAAIHQASDLRGVMGQFKTGDTVTVALLRDGQRQEVQVTLQPLQR
jgi:S1-C subfamily serine protease